jgi:hypothetical protein
MAGFSTGIQAGANAANMILKSQQIGVEERLAAERLKLDREKTGLDRMKTMAEYGPGGLAERRVSASEGQVENQTRQTELNARATRLQEESEAARWNKSLKEKPVKGSMFLTNTIKKVPELSKALNPILEGIDSGEIPDRATFRTRLMQASQSPEMAEARVKVREKAAKALENGKKADAEGLMHVYNALGKEEFEGVLDDVMGMPFSMRRSAAERGQTGKGKEQPTYGDRVWDPRTKSWLQQDSQGKWTKISQESGSGNSRRITGPGFTYEEGPGLTTKTQGTLEQGVVDQKEELARLKNMASGLNTDFLTTSGKASATLLNLKDMWSGGDLSTKERKYVSDYSTFAQDTIENVNLYIKRITGAQMSEQEAGRLTLAVPNMGKTWFTGDGPSKFKAKLQNSIEKLEAANARYNSYLEKGISPQQIKLMIEDGTIGPLSKFTYKGPKPKSGDSLSLEAMSTDEMMQNMDKIPDDALDREIERLRNKGGK